MNKQLNLGQLIELLKKVDPEKDILFDFCHFKPADLNSYRGYYYHLAIGYAQDHEINVAQFLNRLLDIRNRTLTGYKGGEWLMCDETPVWVSPYGVGHNTIISGVTEYCDAVIIETAYKDQ